MDSFRRKCNRNLDFTPLSWDNYFDEAIDIDLNTDDSFRVYISNFKGQFCPNRSHEVPPYSSSPTDLSHNERSKIMQTPTLVLLHGGGYSGLTWSLFCKSISSLCDVRCLAIDLRGHGDTKTSDDDNLNINTMVDDVINVTHKVHQICGFDETPKVILVGHSMGGAISIKCSAKFDDLPSMVGFVVIDVVEGTAKEALPIMMSIINTRPKRFPTIENAIEWSYMTGMTKNIEAARVSMPGNLLNIKDKTLAIHDINSGKNEKLDKLKKHEFNLSIDNLLSNKDDTIEFSTPTGLPPIPPRINAIRRQDINSINTKHSLSVRADIIEEDNEEQVKKMVDENPDYRKPELVNTDGYSWRTSLQRTKPHWQSWFEGLSSQMLEAPVQGKFLLLAGIDRLDRELTIGQMQGKFMMKVLPKCGHAVHEDEPEKVSVAIADFLVRNKFTTQVT